MANKIYPDASAALAGLLIVSSGGTARHRVPLTQRFGNLLPVLIARDSEKSQQGNHGRHSAAHLVLLYVLSGPAGGIRSCVTRTSDLEAIGGVS